MKILYVSTISNTINAFMIPHIELLLDHGHHVDIACNVDSDISSYLTDRGCNVFNIEFQRTPLNKKNYLSYKTLKTLIKNGNYDLVHTHTPVASFLTRIACRKIKHVKVLYTAHGFHFFKGAPFKNWILYYPIERYLAKYTDVLITINKEDYFRAKKSFKAGKVEYIPGVGLDIKKFNEVAVDKPKKRREIGVGEQAFVLLSVGELNKNKNHETIINAIAMLKNHNIYYVICGKGTLKTYLRNLSKDLGIDKQIKFLGYRSDIAEICNVADVFAFPSMREGLGMAALEAMASGLPLVTSNVHGILDYSVDGETGFCCHPTDINGFARAIEELNSSKELRIKMGHYNVSLIKNFSIHIALNKLGNIYTEVSNRI